MKQRKTAVAVLVLVMVVCLLGLVACRKTQLATPQITLDGNVVSWGAIEHATSYEVTVGTDTPVEVTNTRYTVNKSAPGSYDITVVAITTDKNFVNSEKSNVVTYVKTAQVAQLSAPKITLDGNVVSWSAVPNATGYLVTVGDDAAVSVTGTQYTVNKTAAGSYNITVVATSTDSNYTQSAASNTVTFVVAAPANQLATPEVALNVNVLSWKAVEHATGYEVTVGNDEPVALSGDTLSYTVDKTAEGTYAIKVVAVTTEEGYTASAPATATLTLVKAVLDVKVPSNIKGEYFLDDCAQVVDLTGVTAKYTDIYGATHDIEAADLVLSEYDLTTVSDEIEITFSYQGTSAKTKLYVEVKERTIDDVKDCTEILLEYNSDGKYNIGTAKTAVDMKGHNLLVDGKVALVSGKTLIKVDNAYIIVTVAHMVRTAEDFQKISEDMSGYFILQNNIDFESRWQSVLGAAPVKVDAKDPENKVNLPDLTGAGEGGQKGVAFTGTLDGQGYAIQNYKLGIPDGVRPFDPAAYGMAIFGWVGEGAVVENIVLRNVSVSGGKFTSFVAGLNQGTIKNVLIEASCVLSSTYSGGAAISSYNYGTIENVVCQVEEYNGFNSNKLPLPIAATINVAEEITEEVCDIATGFNDTDDHTEVLGAGWKYFAGIGTVLANSDYVLIPIGDSKLAIGEKLYLKDVFSDGDSISIVFFGEKSDELEVKWDSAKSSHYVQIADVAKTTLVAGDKIIVKLQSAGSKYFSTIEITIDAAAVIGYEKDSDNLAPIEGLDLDITTLSIIQKFSDGSQKSIQPVKIEGYNKYGTVGAAQSVKLFWGEGENDFVTITVTLAAKSLTGVVLKDGVSYKDTYLIGTDTVLDLSKITLILSYNNGTSEEAAVTAQMVDAESYNLAAAGVYQVKVTYQSFKVQFPITVQSAALASIAIVGTPAKTSFKIGDVVATADLEGATITATYSDNTSNKGIPIAITMLTYDFSVAGNTNITVTYQGKTATIAVTVVDYATALLVDVPSTQIVYSAATALDVLSGVKFKLEMAGGSKPDADAAKVSVKESDLKTGLRTVTYVYTDGDLTLEKAVQYEIWYELCMGEETVAQAWAFIGDNLDGYFRMTRSMDFENRWQSPLGAAPIKVESANLPDLTGAGTGGQKGIAFTGKFDGQGYAIQNYKLGIPDGVRAWDPAAYGLSIFGWVAEGATVENITLRNVYVQAGKFGSLVAGINQGTIKNICIEASCKINSIYWEGAAVCAYNYGTIENVVCYISTYLRGTDGAEIETPLVLARAVDLGGAASDDTSVAVTNGFMDTDDHAEALGAGWKYFDGIGTVLANDDYALITVGDSTLAIGNKLYLNNIFSNGDKVSVVFYGDKAAEMEAKWDGEKRCHYVQIANLATTTLRAGDKITVKLQSTGSKYFSTIEITIAAAEVIGHEKDTDNLTPIEGVELVLADLDITEKYSDGSTNTVHPVKIEGYNKNGTVGAAQSVKLFWGEGEDEFVTITVTLQAKAITGIEINPEKSFKKNYVKDETLDLTNCEIVVTYNNGTTQTVAVTESMLDANSYSLTTVGTYTVKVTYQTFETSFQMIVSAASLQSIAIVGTPAKTTYNFGESVTAANLVGATITATFSDSSTNTGIAITQEMISATLDTLGSANITITYEGKTATIAVTVVDYDVELLLVGASDELTCSKVVAVDLKAGITFKVKKASGAEAAVEASDVTVTGDSTPGHRAITYTYGTVSKAQEYDIWYLLGATGETPAQAWAVINANLAGYYRMTKDLDFDSAWTNVIGAAPIIKTDKLVPDIENGGLLDTATTGKDSQLGAEFTGRFDGQGYTIKNLKIGREQPSWAYAYGVGIFGWVGEGAVVENINLRNISISAGKYDAIVAGVNQGTIRNICIEDTCSLKCTYSGGSAISSYNYGTIENVVCCVAKYTGHNNNILDLPLATTIDAAYAVTNGFKDTDDHATALGAGWRYFSGLGTVLANNDYVFVTQTDLSLPIGGVLYLDDKFVDGDHITGAMYGEGNGDLQWGWDGTRRSHTISFKDVSTTTLSAGNTIKLVVHVGWRGSHTVIITIVAPVIVGAQDVSSALTPIVGSELELTSINIKLTYSDGSDDTVHPTRVEDYNKNGTAGVAQTVKAFYGEGASDYVTITVTPRDAAAGEVVATALSVTGGSDTLAYSAATALDAKAGRTFTLTLSNGSTATANATDIAVSGTAIGHTTVTYTYTGTYGTISTTKALDIWYEITSATEWAMLNSNLNGYFRLANDIDFQTDDTTNVSVVIGVAPIKGSTEGAMDPAGVGGDPASAPENFNKLGVAFNGKFDGQGYVIKNFKTDYEAAAWQAASWGFALFASVGEDAQIGNFTLSNFNVRAGKYASFVASYNKGLLYNINVLSNCQIYSNWGPAAAVAAFNWGQIKNVVCAVEQLNNSGAAETLQIALNSAGEADTVRMTNCYIATAITGKTSTEIQTIVDTLNTDNSGWAYVPGVGLRYGHFVAVVAPNEVSLTDKTITLNVYSDSEFTVNGLHIWGVGEGEDYTGSAITCSGNEVTINLDGTAMQADTAYAFGVRVNSGYALTWDVTAKESL